MVLQDTISYTTNKSQLENMNGLRWASFIMMSFRVILCILICQVSNLYKHIIYCKISFALSQDNFLIIILRLFYDYRFDQELLLSFPFMHYHHLITEISHSCVIIVRREKLMKKDFVVTICNCCYMKVTLLLYLDYSMHPHLYAFELVTTK